MIRLNLGKWLEKYKGRRDPDGRYLFSRDTEKTTKEQFSKVCFIQDPPGMDMYEIVPPGPRTSHNLSTKLSKRPEPTLEKFHELMAHMGNTGQSPDLADALTMRGACEYNVKCRYRRLTREARRRSVKVSAPGDLETTPLFLDHSLVSY